MAFPARTLPFFRIETATSREAPTSSIPDLRISSSRSTRSVYSLFCSMCTLPSSPAQISSDRALFFAMKFLTSADISTPGPIRSSRSER